MRELDSIRTMGGRRRRKAASTLCHQRRPQLVSLGLSVYSAAGLLLCDASSANGVRRVEFQLESQTLEPERNRTSAANADTVWFAAWEFGDQTCDPAGWTAADNRILKNDGSIHWHMESTFGGQGGIAGQSAAVGYHGGDCCVSPDGYDNDWYQAIRLTYTGAATLSFDYLLDSEGVPWAEGFDGLQLETDSLCASFDRVDYGLDPGAGAASFRKLVLTRDGLDLNGNITTEALTAYGPGLHCVYIVFLSDAVISPCDGDEGSVSTIGDAVVVDNIVLTDADGTRNEDFEDGTLDIGTFVNLHDSEPFGLWARLHPHVTDNDACGGEVRDCAWIFSDPTLLATNPNLAFGPGGAVVRNWLDNVITSPWVSLPPAGLGTAGTVLDYRFFGGNTYNTSRIVHNWSVRTRQPGGGGECVTGWRSLVTNSLSNFNWRRSTPDLGVLTPDIPSDASAIQVRYRVTDWQYLMGAPPPNPLDVGPGPYLDRVRIGRRLLLGPVISSGMSEEGQDNFASDPIVVDGQPTFTPSGDRFGSADFGRSGYSLWGGSTGWVGWENDVLRIHASDSRGAGGVRDVILNGAIVAGPHAGKAPPPCAVGSNGFFQSPGTFNSYWSLDLDDDYFRGGDVLYYFLSASDFAGGFSTSPDGMSTPPSSVEDAEVATGGLFEVSFLPTIDWDPAYLARIAAHPSGKLEPTSAEIAGSNQRTCILYAQWVELGRRSGTANRTAFMYTLDRLGYAGLYDTYDHNTWIHNGQIAGHATVAQASGYSLIVYDAANTITYHALPMGGGREDFWPQTQWFQDWLAQAPQSAAGTATLWILGEDLLEGPTRYLGGNLPNPLLSGEMGLTLVAANQGPSLSPRVEGQTSHTWADSTSTDFTPDRYVLDAFLGCGRAPRRYDGLGATGTATVTHRWANESGLGSGAIVMNASPASHWNTIMMSFWWDDLRTTSAPPGSAGRPLLSKLLGAVLPASCQAGPDSTTDAPDQHALDDPLPRVTAMFPNVPNPFNPVTTIHFDLARDGHVLLRIHDVAGRTMRTLVQGPLARRHHEFVWDGLDSAGRPVSSGVYFTRLHTADGEWTRKLVVLR